MDDNISALLKRRLVHVYVRQRLGIERDLERRALLVRASFFRSKKWYLSPALIRNALRLVGLYSRARDNATRVQVRENIMRSHRIPLEFEGLTILHISDLHVDMNEGAMQNLKELLRDLKYDICVMTGDYRGKIFGPFDATLDGLSSLRAHLKEPVYAVLGNHDSIRMVPGLERMGIRVLLNEAEPIVRHGACIYLAGIDDAHFYRTDNIEKTTSEIPAEAFSILLSHTPEIYRQAAYAGFDVLLSGHTHGGQICLPGSIPVTLDSVLPRRMGAGAWKYQDMTGYTSVGVGTSIVAVRLNCPPEITLHRLERHCGESALR